jgi:hypothetical protein
MQIFGKQTCLKPQLAGPYLGWTSASRSRQLPGAPSPTLR